MKKKQQQEPKRMMYVLKNNEPDTTYGGNKVIAQDSKEKLEQYKQQLIDNGYEDVFTIQEHEYDGWYSGIKYGGYNIVEYNCLLYIQRNIDFAQRRVNDTLFSLKQMIENLSDLKDSMSDGEQECYTVVINSIEYKYDELKNQKLMIKMI